MTLKELFLAVCIISSLSACYTSKIYVVRHAERQDDSADTPLSEVGHQRAKALSDSLYTKGIDSIFVTKYQRTKHTAQPLAERLGKKSEIYDVKQTGSIVERLSKIKGKNVLVVGHSDTVLEIVKGLGTKPSIAKIEHNDYDNLFLVTVNKGLFGKKVTLKENTYGQKTLP